MSANDNLLAGLAGFTEGLANGVVPFMRAQQKATLEDSLAQRDLGRKKDLADYESGLRTKEDKLLYDVPENLQGLYGQKQIQKPFIGAESSLIGKMMMGQERQRQNQEKADKEQDKFEKDARDMIQKVTAYRSGGLGFQDQKVNQAIHLRNLLDQYYDDKTGDYNIPKSQYEELAIGVANLVSGSQTATDSMRSGIVQRTAKGDIAGAIAYATGTTPSASTRDVFKNLSDSVDRQGLVSERLRDKYVQGIKQRLPSRLAPDRREYILKSEIANSYQEELNNSMDKRKKKMPGPWEKY